MSAVVRPCPQCSGHTHAAATCQTCTGRGVIDVPRCIPATSKNTPAVRKGYEMGGYCTKSCASCKRGVDA